MGQLHHRLAGGDDLPRLGQGLDDGAVGVGEQQRISGLVSRDIGLRFGGRQLRVRAVGGRLGLIVSLPRDPAVGGKLAIARFVGPRLGGQRRALPRPRFPWRSARDRDPSGRGA